VPSGLDCRHRQAVFAQIFYQEPEILPKELFSFENMDKKCQFEKFVDCADI
jgi:hypothetical protein